jgi:dolichol-phosphate mannosyltransferase
MTPELMIVMPIYNEQASVRKVVLEWFHEVENWTEDFIFLAINDGSNDGTAPILARLRDQLGPRFEILEQENMGHGQSCLVGYREAGRRNIPFVFQIDSDGQCDPQYFFRFWREREKFDVIYGHRRKREDGWRRVVASHVLRATLLLGGGANCIDANVPYRLMRTANLAPLLNRIPADFFLANIALAVLLRRKKSWRHGSIPIRFRERYGGEPSVRLGKFGEKARELLKQLQRI